MKLILDKRTKSRNFRGVITLNGIKIGKFKGNVDRDETVEQVVYKFGKQEIDEFAAFDLTLELDNMLYILI